MNIIKCYYGEFEVQLAMPDIAGSSDDVKQFFGELLAAGFTATPNVELVILPATIFEHVVTRVARCTWTKNDKVNERLYFYVDAPADEKSFGQHSVGDIYINSDEDKRLFEQHSYTPYDSLPVIESSAAPDVHDRSIVSINMPFVWRLKPNPKWSPENEKKVKKRVGEYVPAEPILDDSGEPIATFEQLVELRAALISGKADADGLLAHFGVNRISELRVGAGAIVSYLERHNPDVYRILVGEGS